MTWLLASMHRRSCRGCHSIGYSISTILFPLSRSPSAVHVTQSKASCMPAHALQPQPGWHVVDCCAAPGNKTTHAAALLHANTAAAAGASSFTDAASKRSKGKRSRLEAEGEAGQQQPAGAGVAAAGGGDVIKVFAFDKDPKRLKRLAANVQKAGAERIVVAQQADFLSIDPQDPLFSQVRARVWVWV